MVGWGQGRAESESLSTWRWLEEDEMRATSSRRVRRCEMAVDERDGIKNKRTWAFLSDGERNWRYWISGEHMDLAAVSQYESSNI
jgi:hypothetical protein